jgi:hypothetical protein
MAAQRRYLSHMASRIEIVGLLLDGLMCLEQRPHHGDQLGTILDQFLGANGKDIELGTVDRSKRGAWYRPMVLLGSSPKRRPLFQPEFR